MIGAQDKKWITFYLTADYPNRELFLRYLDILYRQGADVLELGIPVENPILDGETVRKTHEYVLKTGFSKPDLEGLLLTIRERYPQMRLVVMAYDAGIKQYDLLAAHELYDALLCPDRVYEKENPAQKFVQMYHCDMSEYEMIKKIENNALFAYVMSYIGVTGTANSEVLPPYHLIERLREKIDIPIQVGFGIKNPEQVRQLYKDGADGVIIGSGLIEKVNENDLKIFEDYVHSICEMKQSYSQ